MILASISLCRKASQVENTRIAIFFYLYGSFLIVAQFGKYRLYLKNQISLETRL
jgi:hypothetical protein